MNNLKKNVKDFYEQYHSKRDRGTPYWMSDYWQLFEGKVLEIGCGALVPPTPLNYIGVDITLTPLLKNRSKGYTCIRCDGERLPFRDNSFDTVACHDVLEHVVDPNKFVDEVCRVSRKRVLIASLNYVGTNLYKSNKDLIWRVLGVMFGNPKKNYTLNNPHLSFDNEWYSDADAINASNAYWVKKKFYENGFKTKVFKTFLKRDYLNKIPIVKYCGSFIFIAGERNHGGEI